MGRKRSACYPLLLSRSCEISPMPVTPFSTPSQASPSAHDLWLLDDAEVEHVSAGHGGLWIGANAGSRAGGGRRHVLGPGWERRHGSLPPPPHPNATGGGGTHHSGVDGFRVGLPLRLVGGRAGGGAQHATHHENPRSPPARKMPHGCHLFPHGCSPCPCVYRILDGARS